MSPAIAINHLLYLGKIFLFILPVPRQLGDPLVGKTCPYRHVAVFPPRLVYPPGQLSVRVVPCTTGSAGTVTTLLHVESWVVQSASEMNLLQSRKD